MKTREEIAQELADKKTTENLSEEVQEVKRLLSSFLGDFKAVNLKLEHSYSLKDEVPLKELNDTIKSIPKEFKVKHTTDKISNKFLWWYFSISSIIIAASLFFGAYTYKNTDLGASKEELLQEYNKGKIDGFQEVYNVLPENSQDFLKTKYPNNFKN